MFKNLRTGTKLLMLCSIFVVSIGVATYDLVAEKKIAIDFAQKELIGNRYLATLRSVYAAILASQQIDGTQVQPGASLDELIKMLSSANDAAVGILQTAKLEQALVVKLREFQARRSTNENVAALIPDTLARAAELASRIGDDSNLTLDTDLDTYYVQDIVVTRLPTLLGQLGESRSLFGDGSTTGVDLNERKVRYLVLDSLRRSTTDEIKRNFIAAYRGNTDGGLKRAVDDVFQTMIANSTLFFHHLNMSTAGDDAKTFDQLALERDYAAAVETTVNAWSVAQTQLDRLLRLRINNLRGRLFRSLMIVGALSGLSIIIAIMTHRYIVQPLQRLERIARTVRETKNYGLRSDQNSEDEIGRLAAAFNDMLSELAAARERELFDQSELARVARLTTMGTMTTSIAHEINQPLAAIVANGGAGLRWLGRSPPDLDEVRSVLESIVSDGHRASDVIGSVRKMFKKNGQYKAPVDVNNLIREVLNLVQGELRSQRVLIQTELFEHVPQVLGDRVQLQQVLLNLILNAVEAMASITDRSRFLHLKSECHESNSVLVTVEDSGIGIDSSDMDHLFDAFYTTKSKGMGMGLAICRSIVEAHGGRIWASSNAVHGSAFYVKLPSSPADDK
jgi:signal transduction histidine kinase